MKDREIKMIAALGLTTPQGRKS